jgi:fatty-acid desaturase
MIISTLNKLGLASNIKLPKQRQMDNMRLDAAA